MKITTTLFQLDALRGMLGSSDVEEEARFALEEARPTVYRMHVEDQKLGGEPDKRNPRFTVEAEIGDEAFRIAKERAMIAYHDRLDMVTAAGVEAARREQRSIDGMSIDMTAGTEEQREKLAQQHRRAAIAGLVSDINSAREIWHAIADLQKS